MDDLTEEVTTATNRDIPLVKGTIRAMVETDIETVHDLPAAGRTFGARIDEPADRERRGRDEMERRLADLGDVGTRKTTKEQKLAAILAFAVNKRGEQAEKVAVSATEIRGCVGVSRRYAYDLMHAMAAEIEGVSVRESKRVQTSSGIKRKKKALLVDCERVHSGTDGVNEFTTGGDDNEGA